MALNCQLTRGGVPALSNQHVVRPEIAEHPEGEGPGAGSSTVAQRRRHNTFYFHFQNKNNTLAFIFPGGGLPSEPYGALRLVHSALLFWVQLSPH
jgi:hypothetical protein